MKIFCMEGNYAGCGITKCMSVLPDSTLLYSERPFFVPDFDPCFTARLSVALRINRLGKNIDPKFAPRYYCEWTAAISIRANGMLQSLRSHGLPWDSAIAFDRSLIAGNFMQVTDSDASGDPVIPDLLLKLDGEVKAVWSHAEMTTSINESIAYASSENTIKTGDLVLCALSPAQTQLTPGHLLEIITNEKDILLTTPIR